MQATMASFGDVVTMSGYLPMHFVQILYAVSVAGSVSG